MILEKKSSKRIMRINVETEGGEIMPLQLRGVNAGIIGAPLIRGSNCVCEKDFSEDQSLSVSSMSISTAIYTHFTGGGVLTGAGGKLQIL